MAVRGLPSKMQSEADAEAWRAHCRNVVAIVEGTVVGETAPEEPVMAGEVVRVEAEAESEPVGASDVRSAEPAASTQPVEDSSDEDSSYVPDENTDDEMSTSEDDSEEYSGSEEESESEEEEQVASETMEREAPAEGAAGEKKKKKKKGPPPEELSTDEISGEYFPDFECQAFPPGEPGTCLSCCSSITVMPHGPDAIETFTSSWGFCPIGCFGGNLLFGSVYTRGPGTQWFGGPNYFRASGGSEVKFSADGSFRFRDTKATFRRRPGSQKRAFPKVETRDIAGDWCRCHLIPIVPLWPLSPYVWTTKEALDKDRYEEKGRAGILCFPIIPISTETYKRKYFNGHPTNGFVRGKGYLVDDTHWYRDAGCAGRYGGCYFEKKIG